MTVCGVSVLNTVVFVLTLNPLLLASLMASTASSNTPSLQTDSSCRSRSPSMCPTNAKYGEGVNLCRCLGSSTALVHRNTNFFLATSWRTISSICGCISGSAPASETIGAPHSSTAPIACSTGMRCLSTVCGCWILPQPAHLRLHANSGSSSTSSGNLLLRASFCFIRYDPIRMLWRIDTLISPNLSQEGSGFPPARILLLLPDFSWQAEPD